MKLDIDREKTVCFTGYRSNKFPFMFENNNDKYNNFELKLLYTIESSIKDGYNTFLNGACEGFDILSAELVLLLKKVYNEKNIRLVYVVPFIGQEKGWGTAWQSRYNSVLERADEAIVLSEKYYRGCYYVRNKYLVDNSSLIICYYDGQVGGTKYTLNYNSDNRKSKVINVSEGSDYGQ